jgi:hypothetical protein
MNNKRIIEMLSDQLQLAAEREKVLLEQAQQQTIQINSLTQKIASLTLTIQSLQDTLLEKKDAIQGLKGQNRGLGKLLSNKSEKILPVAVTPKPAVNRKERGNNNAKRKEHFNLETIVEDVYPNDPLFDQEKARELRTVESTIYECKPLSFVKHIYRQHNYVLNEKMYSGTVPRTPFLNSNFDGSFVASVLQLRYIYSMPIERIVKYFCEHGFEINKATVHHLVKNAAKQMDRLNKVLKKEILNSRYLNMDESYHTVLTAEDKQTENGRGSRKGYIWAALASETNLIQYFYENGSRAMDVLTNYIPATYRGAIQCDGLANYKVLETDAYPNVLRLSCFQHCKRKFADIEGDTDARQVIALINKLSHKEHQIKEDWKPDKILKYRQQYAPPVLDKLKNKLLQIQSNPATLPQSPLAKATAYTLKEYDALCNYILSPNYKLDNNAIERYMRYISLSRKNSLFCGSHAGATRTALIYSLACSCRLNKVNSFEYFADLLNRLAYISPNAADEVFQELLPHKWRKI